MDESRNAEVQTAVWTQVDEYESDHSTDEEEVTLGVKILAFLRMYWKRRAMAFAIIVTGIVLSVVYSLLLPNVYTSNTSLMPPDNSSPYSSMLQMLSGSGSAAALGGEALGLSTPAELIVSILQSRTVFDGMIGKYDLVRHYRAHGTEAAQKALAGSTSIDQDRKSGIITISVTDMDPQFACKLADGYVTQLNRVMTENSTSAARRERIFLEERLKDVKSDLDDSSRALSQFSTKSKAIDIPAQARSMMDASLRLQSMLAEGESQLAGLRQTYSEDNYRVKALEARNAELQRQLNSLGAVSKPSSSISNSDGPYPSVGDLPKLGLTYYDLERKVRVDEAVWETLSKQYEMARVQEAKEIPTIRVLDEANVPASKSGPRRSIIVLTVTFLSFLLSCLVVFVVGTWESLAEDSTPKRLVRERLGSLRRKSQEPAVRKA